MRGRKCPWWCVFLNRNNTLLLHRHVAIADLIKSKAWHAKIISTRSVSLRFRRRICLLSTGCSWPGKEFQCNFWGVCYNVSDEGLQNLSNVVTWNGSWTTIHQPHLVCWTRMDGEARLSWTIWPMKGSVCKWRQARSRTYLMTESVALPVHRINFTRHEISPRNIYTGLKNYREGVMYTRFDCVSSVEVARISTDA